MKKIILLFALVFLTIPGLKADNVVEPATITVAATSTAVYPATPNLKDAIFVNSGAIACFFSCTGTAVLGRGIYLPVGKEYRVDSTNLRRGPFSAITASGTTSLTVSVNLGQK